jgi:hypothetical protein
MREFVLILRKKWKQLFVAICLSSSVFFLPQFTNKDIRAFRYEELIWIKFLKNDVNYKFSGADLAAISKEIAKVGQDTDQLILGDNSYYFKPVNSQSNLLRLTAEGRSHESLFRLRDWLFLSIQESEFFLKSDMKVEVVSIAPGSFSVNQLKKSSSQVIFFLLITSVVFFIVFWSSHSEKEA